MNQKMIAFNQFDLPNAVSKFAEMCISLALRVGGMYLILAAADYAYQRWDLPSFDTPAAAPPPAPEPPGSGATELSPDITETPPLPPVEPPPLPEAEIDPEPDMDGIVAGIGEDDVVAIAGDDGVGEI